ncbi:LytTR family DNA-binding domain-containing protein [Olivibacter sp. CPCC 100613]|uniref:LytR/AlgR family response regulator transcription factor n=1 Tax=Olivibacter sp. CPCC 100613 TaxID=3079931 RepID=UPI002FF80795
MIKCIAIDDEPAALQQLELYLQEFPYVELIGTTTSPLQGLEMIKQMKPNALFLDMEMDEMNGTEVLGKLKSDIKVIVCTAFSEFALESFEHDVVDYLLKPMDMNRFTKAVERLRGRITHQPVDLFAISNDYVFIKYERKLKRIDYDDIIYIEARKNDVVFHLHQEFLLSTMPIKDVQSKLSPQEGFIRIHRSYIVAIKMIDTIDEGMVKLKNGTSLIIGGMYREYLLNYVYPSI